MFADRLISPIRRSLADPSAEVRAAGARAFDLLYSGIHLRAVDEILPELFNLLEDTEKHDIALDGIRQLLLIRERAVMPYLVPKLTRPRLDAKTFAYLAPLGGNSLGRYLNRILPAFMEAAAKVDAGVREDVDLRYCSLVLASVSETTGMRSILQELITGLALNDSNAPQFEYTTPRPNTTEYCYACLRLLHVYLEAFLVDNDEELSDLQKELLEMRKRMRGSTSKMVESDGDESSDEGDSSDDASLDDSDDDYDDDEEEEGAPPRRISNDDGDDDDSETSDYDIFPRGDSKEVLRHLIPDYYTPLLRNLSKLMAVKDMALMTYAWACLETILKVTICI